MMNEITNYDENFTESKFKTFVDNVFIQIHLAIMTKELEKIKHFVNDTIYQSLELKVNSLGSLIQVYDEINVKQTTILSIKMIDDEFYIEVNITSRYMDYLIDENGKFVSGNNSDRIEKENYLIFKKKKKKTNDNVFKCPGCGASIDVNANGLCKYCGTTYNLEDKGWILVSLKIL